MNFGHSSLIEKVFSYLELNVSVTLLTRIVSILLKDLKENALFLKPSTGKY